MISNVCVVLPVFNAQATLVRLLTELLDVVAELTPRFEVKIVDDGSTDSTFEIAREFAVGYPQIGVIRHSLRLGSIGAMHSGLAQAAARYALFCNEGCGGNIDDLAKIWPPAQEQELVVGTEHPINRVVPSRRRRPRSTTLDNHGAAFLLASLPMARDWSLSTNNETLTDWAARSRYPIRYVQVRIRPLSGAATHQHVVGAGTSGGLNLRVDPSDRQRANAPVERPKLLSIVKQFAAGE